ncbi:SusD/RagB family nutrient-binding outer membrane lipoprotein [Chryseobacterium lactis]|uniref:SusD/RagB family nutrient-binding outer membrane lipoprotein n=1 Tax=Chryseobacterium lactis TaxID=1241981 RepID=UPI001628B9F5|nr:SusD/RagB family nutrient-binding outer membrane lipoprotein [Chryseobacterium lactis]
MENIIKKLFLSAGLMVLAFSLTSCERDMTSLNNDPKHPNSLKSGNLLASGQYENFYNIYTGSVNSNNFRFFIQQWTETIYTDETNYNLVTRNQPRTYFTAMYVRVLNSFYQAQKNLPAELTVDEENSDIDVYNNKWAILELSSIFVWENIVDTYGDVPYSEALQVETNKSPKYDDAKTIYLDLLKRIDASIAKIKVGKGSYGTYDLVYKGDMSKWLKLANSLKLRLAINLADVDPATSKTAAESAIASGVFTANGDSYSLVFDGGTFTNPLFDDLVAAGRNDFLPSDILVNRMNTTSDPRRAFYFTPLDDGTYKGGVYGIKNSFSKYSHVNPTYTKANAPANLLSYSEVLFLQAEAAARGYSVSGTATGLFSDAIKASMRDNGVAEADITTYTTANPLNMANWKQSIGNEAWVALWNNPFGAWNFVRRLDTPVLPAPAGSLVGGVPVRMPYSDREYDVNKTNVTAAANKIGGDKATTKLFWDKF